MQCGSLVRCQPWRQAYDPFDGWPSCIAPDKGHVRLRGCPVMRHWWRHFWCSQRRAFKPWQHFFQC